jgi:hypothetical protein
MVTATESTTTTQQQQAPNKLLRSTSHPAAIGSTISAIAVAAVASCPAEKQDSSSAC